MRKPFFTALFLEVFFQANNLMALQIYPLVDQHKTEVPVSRDQQNRISVAGDRIQQIFGAEEIDVQTDDESGQIFVRFLNASQKKPLTLTIVTESGVTHDLKFIPQAIEFQSILLKSSLKTEPPIKAPLSHAQHLATLIKTMALGKKAEGYTLSVLKNTERQYSEPLSVRPQLVYRGETEEGHVYLLKNEGDETIPLDEAVLAFPQDLALSLTRTCLEPGQKSYLFVVSKTRRAS